MCSFPLLFLLLWIVTLSSSTFVPLLLLPLVPVPTDADLVWALILHSGPRLSVQTVAAITALSPLCPSGRPWPAAVGGQTRVNLFAVANHRVGGRAAAFWFADYSLLLTLIQPVQAQIALLHSDGSWSSCSFFLHLSLFSLSPSHCPLLSPLISSGGLDNTCGVRCRFEWGKQMCHQKRHNQLLQLRPKHRR